MHTSERTGCVGSANQGWRVRLHQYVIKRANDLKGELETIQAAGK